MRGGRARRSSSRSCCDASVIGTQRVVRVCDCLRRFGGAYVVSELHLPGWRLQVRGAGVLRGLEYNPGPMARRATKKSGGKRKAGPSRPRKRWCVEGRQAAERGGHASRVAQGAGRAGAAARGGVAGAGRSDAARGWVHHVRFARGLDVGGAFLLHEVWATARDIIVFIRRRLILFGGMRVKMRCWRRTMRRSGHRLRDDGKKASHELLRGTRSLRRSGRERRPCIEDGVRRRWIGNHSTV